MSEVGELKDPCLRTGAEHELKHWFKLGKKDDGTWAWRCGNCLEVRTSEKEEGGPDPVRAAVLAET